MGIMKSAGTHATTKTLLPNTHTQRLLQVPLLTLHLHSKDTLLYSQPATCTKWQWGTTETVQAVHHILSHKPWSQISQNSYSLLSVKQITSWQVTAS